MTGILHDVDRRTQLAGANRLELLMFRAGGNQLYGINVFKVREVIQCPALTGIPDSHMVVKGVAHLRGSTISVMDMSMALGGLAIEKTDGAFVIITEFNRMVQGFLVDSVDRIVNIKWDQVLPPPKGTDKGSYMTAVTRVDEQLVEIIDVEKVLAEVMGVGDRVSSEVAGAAAETGQTERVRRVLVADDSMVARNQIKRALEQVGVECVLARDGADALRQLEGLAKGGTPVEEQVAMIISDIEMPEMDGYTLTAKIRQDPRLRDMRVMLHSSMSGVFNNALAEKVGADGFLAKFDASELASSVLDYIKGPAQ